jgi:peptide/nickel transport system permease protein
MSLLNFAVDEIANPRLRTGNHLKRWSLLVRSGEGRL